MWNVKSSKLALKRAVGAKSVNNAIGKVQNRLVCES